MVEILSLDEFAGKHEDVQVALFRYCQLEFTIHINLFICSHLCVENNGSIKPIELVSPLYYPVDKPKLNINPTFILCIVLYVVLHIIGLLRLRNLSLITQRMCSRVSYLAYPPEELNGFHTTTKPTTVNIRLLLLLPVHMNLIKHSCYAFWLSKKYKFHFIGGLVLRMAGLPRNSRIKNNDCAFLYLYVNVFTR